MAEDALCSGIEATLIVWEIADSHMKCVSISWEFTFKEIHIFEQPSWSCHWGSHRGWGWCRRRRRRWGGRAWRRPSCSPCHQTGPSSLLPGRRGWKIQILTRLLEPNICVNYSSSSPTPKCNDHSKSVNNFCYFLSNKCGLKITESKKGEIWRMH